MSLYDDLGVHHDASAESINTAYRRQAKTHHPDTGGDPAMFAKLSRAVAILRDPEKRAKYDATGTVDDAPDNSHAGGVQVLVAAFQQAMSQPIDFERFDMVRSTTDLLRAQLQAISINRQGVIEQRQKLTKALGRLSSATGKSVLGGFLESQIAALNLGMAQLEEAEAHHKAAIEMAKDYSWRVDVQEPMPSFFRNTGTGSPWATYEYR